MICKCPKCKQSYTIAENRKGEIFCCLECGEDFILDNKKKRLGILFFFSLFVVLAAIITAVIVLLMPANKPSISSNAEDGLSEFERGIEIIKQNNYNALSSYFKKVNIDCRGPEGTTLLMYCVQNKDLSTTQHLLSLGADINLEDNENLAAVHYAVLNNDVKMLEELLAKNAKIDDSKNPLVSLAAERGHIDVVKFLLSINSNFRAIEMRNSNQENAIFRAIYSNQTECIQLLLDQYDLNSTRDMEGNTPLHAATSTENIKLVRLLLKRGLYVHIKNALGDSPFLVAVKKNSPELIAAFSDTEIDYQQANASGETIPMVAALNANMQILKVSLNESNLNLVDREGRSVLCYACLSGNEVIFDFVLSKNPPCESENLLSSPLYVAMKARNAYAVSKLLAFETAQCALADDDGNSLLMHAAMTGDKTVFGILLKKMELSPDFNLFQVNNNKKNVLDLAIEANATRIVEIIRARMQQTYYELNVEPVLADIKKAITISDCRAGIAQLEKLDVNLISEKRHNDVDKAIQSLKNKICWLSDAEIEKAISEAKIDKYYNSAIRNLNAAIEKYPEAMNLDKARNFIKELEAKLQAEIARQERIRALKEKVNNMSQSELQEEVQHFINSWMRDMKNDRSTGSYWKTPAMGKTLYSLNSWEILVPDHYSPTFNKIILLISSSTRGGIPIRQRWKLFMTRNDDMEWKILSFDE